MIYKNQAEKMFFEMNMTSLFYMNVKEIKFEDGSSLVNTSYEEEESNVINVLWEVEDHEPS